jgi:RND superfamily putative drug exporter
VLKDPGVRPDPGPVIDPPADRPLGRIEILLVGLVRAAIAHPVLTLALWGLLVMGGVLGTGNMASVATNAFSGPQGSESSQVDAILQREFPEVTAPNALVLLRHPDVAVPDAYYARLKHELGTVPEVERIFLPDELGSQGRLDEKTAAVLLTFRQGALDQSQVVPAIRERIRAAAAPPGVETAFTGEISVSYDAYTHVTAEIAKVEKIGLLLSLFVLLYVFGGWFPALLPLVSGALVLAVSNGVLMILATGFETSTINQLLTAVLALALGIDYPLFMIARLREELALGRSLRFALEEMARTTGKALLASGGVVMAAAGCMATVDVYGMRPAAINAAATVALAWLVTMTFIPALIALCDRRWSAHDLLRNRFQFRESEAYWKAFVSRVVARPVPVLLGCLIFLGALALPVFQGRFWSPTVSLIPAKLESARGVAWLTEHHQPGQISPLMVVVETERPAGVYAPNFLAGLDRLVGELRQDPRIARVDSMVSFRDDLTLREAMALYQNPFTRAQVAAPLINGSEGGSATVLRIAPATSPDSDDARALVEDLRRTVLPDYAQALQARIMVGGQQAKFVDVFHAFSQAMPFMVGLNFLAIGLLLARLLRSAVLPLKAILTNLLPIMAAFGVVVMVFQWGWGADLIGANANGYVMLFTPTILLTVLYAISMDYEVMILSRIREAYDRTGDNRQAVTEGVTRTGRVVLGGALILLSVFAAYLFADFGLMKEIGLALSVAILIDATIVRLLLLPAAMVVLGDWNYWSPRSRPSRS